MLSQYEQQIKAAINEIRKPWETTVHMTTDNLFSSLNESQCSTAKQSVYTGGDVSHHIRVNIFHNRRIMVALFKKDMSPPNHKHYLGGKTIRL